MNKVLIGIVIVILLVGLPLDETLAGRGGGGGGGRGGGGFGGGGGGFGGGGGANRASFSHTPSFNAPAGGNFSRSNANFSNRSLPQNMDFNRSNFASGNRTDFGRQSGPGQGLEVGQRGNIENRQGFGENRTGIADRANFENRANINDERISEIEQISATVPISGIEQSPETSLTSIARSTSTVAIMAIGITATGTATGTTIGTAGRRVGGAQASRPAGVGVQQLRPGRGDTGLITIHIARLRS